MKNRIIVLLILVSFSCSTKENKRDVSVDTLSTTSTIVDSVKGVHGIDARKSKIALFDKDQDFDVINSKQGITDQSSERDTTICKSWTIEKKDIKGIIKECEPLSGEDWHHLFDVLPCIVKGQIIQNNQTYDFKINAGSWLYISSTDTTFRLGSFKKENEKYFLSGVDR